MLIDELPSEVLMAFLRNLALVQLTDTDDRALKGSFLLPQGPSPDPGSPPDIWTSGQLHFDGASFHACHIADALLHIPSQLADCRAEAEPILRGIREFLIRSFADNEGWLVDLNAARTPITLYAYALCPALHIPLPITWREVTAECNRLASSSSRSVLKRFFGVMNAAYAGHSLDDADFSLMASEFVARQLATLPTDEDVDHMAVRDVAGLLRSLLYGVDWLDEKFASSMRAAIIDAL